MSFRLFVVILLSLAARALSGCQGERLKESSYVAASVSPGQG
jgi:hypothetical protein